MEVAKEEVKKEGVVVLVGVVETEVVNEEVVVKDDVKDDVKEVMVVADIVKEEMIKGGHKFFELFNLYIFIVCSLCCWLTCVYNFVK